MKTHYFVENHGAQSGPYSFGELKEKKIMPKTRVWRTGLENWTYAENIEELRPILIHNPPPLAPIKRELYDHSYDREILASLIGFVLLLSNIFFILSDYKIGKESMRILGILGFVVEILIVVWVTSIAHRQNRSRLFWGIFALLLPPISLIVIGFMRKLKGVTPNFIEEERKDINFNVVEYLKEWKEKNSTRSINDFYAEINRRKKP